MKVYPAITDWQMPAYTPFKTPLNGVYTLYSWVRYRSLCLAALLPCPLDILDIVYPAVVVDHWLSSRSVN